MLARELDGSLYESEDYYKPLTTFGTPPDILKVAAPWGLSDTKPETGASKAIQLD